jgi:transcriptional regulator with XRE-family HTH domain
MHHFTQLRTLRKRYDLSQQECAELIGVQQSTASRTEAADATPDLETALGIQVVFGVTPADVFPTLYAKVEDAVMRRAAEFERRLTAAGAPDRSPKRQLLIAMAWRAKANWRGI